MLTQTHWKETFDYEPWNPTQKAMVHYTGLPGGYSTFYYNHVPNTTTLVGPQLPMLVGPQLPMLVGPDDLAGFGLGKLILIAVLAAGVGVGAGYLASRAV